MDLLEIQQIQNKQTSILDRLYSQFFKYPKFIPTKQVMGLSLPTLHLMTESKVASKYSTLVDAARDLRPGFVRVYLSWKDVEAVEGERNWFWYDEHLLSVTRIGANILLIIDRSPFWAARTPGEPIYSDKINSYLSFVRELVQRYSKPPWNIHYYEICNEPDNSSPAVWESGISCWGNYGVEYAHLLASVYPVIKQTDPQSVVLMGGVAYEDFAAFKRSFVTSVKFAGGYNYVDGYNFHFYPEFSSFWEHLVPKVKGINAKILYWKRVVGSNKPLWITETGKQGIIGDEKSLQGQADYLKLAYTSVFNALGKQADYLFWFALNTSIEANYGLLDDKWNPKPAFQTYKSMFSK